MSNSSTDIRTTAVGKTQPSVPLPAEELLCCSSVQACICKFWIYKIFQSPPLYMFFVKLSFHFHFFNGLKKNKSSLSVLVLTCSVHPEFTVANTLTGNILEGGTRAYLISWITEKKKKERIWEDHTPRLHEIFMGKTGPHFQIWGYEKYSGTHSTNLLALSSRRHWEWTFCQGA